MCGLALAGIHFVQQFSYTFGPNALDEGTSEERFPSPSRHSRSAANDCSIFSMASILANVAKAESVGVFPATLWSLTPRWDLPALSPPWHWW